MLCVLLPRSLTRPAYQPTLHNSYFWSTYITSTYISSGNPQRVTARHRSKAQFPCSSWNQPHPKNAGLSHFIIRFVRIRPQTVMP